MERLARTVVARGLSVRQTEALVKRERDGKPPAPEVDKKSAGVKDLELRLTRALGARTAVKAGKAGAGLVEIATARSTSSTACSSACWGSDGAAVASIPPKPPERQFTRAAVSFEIEYQSAGAFLVAYSSNLSKGGVFIEMAEPLPKGTVISLRFRVPGGDEVIDVEGRVAWVRSERGGEDQPVGVGIEFSRLEQRYGEVIDRLVSSFNGIQIATLCQVRDRAQLTRVVKSAMTCHLVEMTGPEDAGPAMESGIDLVVAVVHDPDDGALEVIRLARGREPAVPVIALVHGPAAREAAGAAGADQTLPTTRRRCRILQQVIIRLIWPGRPRSGSLGARALAAPAGRGQRVREQASRWSWGRPRRAPA